MSAADMDVLLVSCDRSTTSGRREYAILALLARLGPRSGEVAALDLGDIDWRAGEILVRGKARRPDRLPLPVEVGEALVIYLESYPGDGKWIFTTTSLAQRHKDFASEAPCPEK